MLLYWKCQFKSVLPKYCQQSCIVLAEDCLASEVWFIVATKPFLQRTYILETNMFVYGSREGLGKGCFNYFIFPLELSYLFTWHHLSCWFLRASLLWFSLICSSRSYKQRKKCFVHLFPTTPCKSLFCFGFAVCGPKRHFLILNTV